MFCRVAVPKPGQRPRAPSLPPFLPTTGLSKGLGATPGLSRKAHPGSCAASLPVSPLGVGHPRQNLRRVFPPPPPNQRSHRPSPLFPRPGVSTPAGPVLAHWRPWDQELSVISPQDRGACGRKRGAAARCHGDPGRPRVRGCPRPGPGSGPSSDPEASVSTIASPPLPAAAFSPGRQARRPLSARAPYPWRRRRLGRRVPGPRQQLPSGARRPPRRLRPGPPRPTALPAAGGRPGGPAAPRRGRRPGAYCPQGRNRPCWASRSPAGPEEGKGAWGRPPMWGAGGRDPGRTTRLSPSGLHRSAKAAFPRGCEPRANVYICRSGWVNYHTWPLPSPLYKLIGNQKNLENLKQLTVGSNYWN